jgi:uncharacterized membrane protein YdfJ with MMPL/SSD domain
MILVTGLLLGTVSFLKLELNAATAIVAAISIGLGVDYAIHLIQRFREERDLSVAVSRTGEALFAAFFHDSVGVLRVNVEHDHVESGLRALSGACGLLCVRGDGLCLSGSALSDSEIS